jgi:hypothetical protein
MPTPTRSTCTESRKGSRFALLGFCWEGGGHEQSEARDLDRSDDRGIRGIGTDRIRGRTGAGRQAVQGGHWERQPALPAGLSQRIRGPPESPACLPGSWGFCAAHADARPNQVLVLRRNDPRDDSGPQGEHREHVLRVDEDALANSSESASARRRAIMGRSWAGSSPASSWPSTACLPPRFSGCFATSRGRFASLAALRRPLVHRSDRTGQARVLGPGGVSNSVTRRISPTHSARREHDVLELGRLDGR